MRACVWISRTHIQYIYMFHWYSSHSEIGGGDRKMPWTLSGQSSIPGSKQQRYLKQDILNHHMLVMTCACPYSYKYICTQDTQDKNINKILSEELEAPQRLNHSIGACTMLPAFFQQFIWCPAHSKCLV